MKRIVKYISLDPYYSDVVQTYIGDSTCELDDIQYETEKAMQSESLFQIYKVQLIKSEYEDNI